MYGFIHGARDGRRGFMLSDACNDRRAAECARRRPDRSREGRGLYGDSDSNTRSSGGARRGGDRDPRLEAAAADDDDDQESDDDRRRRDGFFARTGAERFSYIRVYLNTYVTHTHTHMH